MDVRQIVRFPAKLGVPVEHGWPVSWASDARCVLGMQDGKPGIIGMEKTPSHDPTARKEGTNESAYGHARGLPENGRSSK